MDSDIILSSSHRLFHQNTYYQKATKRKLTKKLRMESYCNEIGDERKGSEHFKCGVGENSQD